MKKMLLVSAASALFVAGSALAQSETVTSVNVVGYMTVTIPTNGLALITPVVESFDPGTIEDLDNGQLPNGADAYIWNSGGYLKVSKDTRGNWTGSATTNIILRGDAVWIAPNNATADTTFTMMGEVPGAYNAAATTTVANISGTDAVGYSYPVDILWTNTALSSQLPNGSDLYIWNLGTQGYNKFSKDTRGNWTGSGISTLEIKTGEAFWVTTSTPLDWDETVPYDL